MIEEQIEEEYKWYSGKYDRCFKEVMLKEKNKDLLKLLLEHILKVEIYKIEIKNNDKNKGNIHIKGMRTDLSLETNIGYINVEVNSNPEKYVHPRNFSYLADTYSHDTLVGKEYNEKTKYIQINLSYGFMLTENNKLKEKPLDTEPIREYRVMDKEGKMYIENFIIYELNMDYYLNLWYTKDTKKMKKEKILVMLGLDKEGLKKLSVDDKVVSRYMEEVNTVNEDPKFREYISYEEDQRKIQNTLLREAKENGIEYGINSRNIEIAKNMLRNDIEIEKIMNSTGLPEEEIIELSKELNINPKYREYISYEEDQRKIQNTLLREAEERGINNSKIEIAKNMLRNEIEIEKIVNSTGLNEEEILKMANNLKINPNE